MPDLMPMRRAWPWIVLGLVVAAGVLGWQALSFNQVGAVAHALVVRPDGDADLAVWAAAFTARYPQGAPADGLESFVAGHRGRCAEFHAGSMLHCGDTAAERPAACAQEVKDRLHCVLPLAGTVCASTGLAIEAHLDAGRTLSRLQVRRRDAMC